LLLQELIFKNQKSEVVCSALERLLSLTFDIVATTRESAYILYETYFFASTMLPAVHVVISHKI